MNRGDRIPTLVKTLQSVADWATKLEPTGISLRFLNNINDEDGKFDNLVQLEQIEHVFGLVKFAGKTNLGDITRKKILERRILEEKQKKPLIVVIITDGTVSSTGAHLRVTLSYLQYSQQIKTPTAFKTLLKIVKLP
jgi:hypothetical protein